MRASARRTRYTTLPLERRYSSRKKEKPIPLSGYACLVLDAARCPASRMCGVPCAAPDRGHSVIWSASRRVCLTLALPQVCVAALLVGCQLWMLSRLYYNWGRSVEPPTGRDHHQPVHVITPVFNRWRNLERMLARVAGLLLCRACCSHSVPLCMAR